MPPDRDPSRERAQNLWSSFERKFAPIAKAARLEAAPAVGVEQIGGLVAAKEEVLTYACAATDPEVYEHWGTFPSSALLMIGRMGVGKTLLAAALATRSGTPFLRVDVPRLVVEVIHRGGQVGELLEAWSQTLAEMPPLTVFFEELEFSRAEEIGSRRTDLPVGPIMDFLLDLVDRAIANQGSLVAGSTAHPDTLRTAFLTEGRFERIVEVAPVFPDDIVEALRIHQLAAEKRAGRALFDAVDWHEVVSRYQGPSTGEWIRVLHAALRRKARCEAAGEDEGPVTTAELQAEVERLLATRQQLPEPGSCIYL
ncbi:MAG TPA: ATP-binding protein [Myxococcota bacterium]|nr:ATP-binding protein [Myxococcota bacterium]